MIFLIYPNRAIFLCLVSDSEVYLQDCLILADSVAIRTKAGFEQKEALKKGDREKSVNVFTYMPHLLSQYLTPLDLLPAKTNCGSAAFLFITYDYLHWLPLSPLLFPLCYRGSNCALLFRIPQSLVFSYCYF